MRNMKFFTLALMFNALSGCGSSGGAEATAAAVDLGKACDTSVQQCVEQGQAWVWDEENYDSFAHQQMSEILMGSLDSSLTIFEGITTQISAGPDGDYILLADRWAVRYADVMDSFIVQVKPIIMNTYTDYGASTTPDAYLSSANSVLDEIKDRLQEEYDVFIEPNFAPYSDASDHLATLKLLEPYISDIDTVSIEIAVEIK